MKLGTAFAALTLALAGSTLMFSTTVSAEDVDWAKSVTAEAKRADGKVTILLKPTSGVYVNTEYDLKCTLTIAEGGKLEKSELRKADAKFEDAGKPGKAKSATLATGADKTVTGECKLVACNDGSCSAPFKLPVKSN